MLLLLAFHWWKMRRISIEKGAFIKEPKDMTLEDAQEHLKTLIHRIIISIPDPIAYFKGKIFSLENKLADLEEKKGEIPEGMTQEEAIAWLANVLAYQKTYLVCLEKNSNDRRNELC